MKGENKDEYITLRATPSVKAALEQMAEEDERTVTNMITVLITRAVRQWREEKGISDGEAV